MTNHTTHTQPHPRRTAQHTRRTTWLTILLPGLLVGIIASTAPAGLAAPAGHTPLAHVARTLKATDTANLRYIKHSGSQLFEEGSAQGDLPGSMRANLSIGATFTASFTIYTHGGTITGHGSATPHGASLDEHFSGTLTVTGGTGRYTHAHGHAGLSGTFNRRTYAVTLQTSGSLSY
jgi:hypothetical protein